MTLSAEVTEPSSSLSFTSTSYLSNGPVSHTMCASNNSDAGPKIEVISLSKLNADLEQLLLDSCSDYRDAEIVVEGIPISFH